MLFRFREQIVYNCKYLYIGIYKTMILLGVGGEWEESGRRVADEGMILDD